MKISPIAISGAGSSANPDEGKSAGAERVARAKAVLAGGTAAITSSEADRTPVDAQLEQVRASIKKIRMRTNATPGAREYEAQATETPAVENVAAAPESIVSDPVEATEPVTEVTKPISPQFAALAKKERALQVKEREIQAREQAISAKETGTSPSPDLVARLKADPLSVLDENGVTYDQLTEALLARSQDQGPAYQKLQAEIKALKEGLDNQTKSQAERDQSAKVQVLAQMQKDADKIVAASGETYELVREAGYTKKAVDLVERTYDKTGEVLDIEEALSLIEAELVEEGLKYSRIKKVQAKLAPAAQIPAQASTQKPIRTLTNRDGTTVPMSRRERALRAARGELN